MRWLITGAGGMLGTDVTTALIRHGEEVRPLTRSDLDITDLDACHAAVQGCDVVVNCAAWTAVDDAEAQEAAAYAVNATGAAMLARAADAADARMVQISTDYVLAGNATSPYPEDAPVAARSAYGRTKAAGEEAVRAQCPDSLIVRTAWLYGAHGPCFPRTIARLLAEREHIDVVDDQTGQPTWTADVADLLVQLVSAKAPAGTYHATASGSVTWYGFARAIAEELGVAPERVRTTTSAAYARPAPRPAYSVLGHDALIAAGVEPIANWRQRWSAASGNVLVQESSMLGDASSASSPSRYSP